MPRLFSTAPITALIYSDSARAAIVMRRLVAAAAAAGASVQGYVQHNVARPGRSRCDMMLENISTGHRVAISEDRGPGARGCQLDAHSLAEAVVSLQRGLPEATDLLILNKFGKVEAEGGGFRLAIAAAIDRGIPVVLGVSWRNIEAWRAFAGELCHEVRLDDLEQAQTVFVLDGFGLSATPREEVVMVTRSSRHLPFVQ